MCQTPNVHKRLVNFKVTDVYHPDPNQLLRELHGDDLLQGVLLDISQGPTADANYAVVKVDGLATPVIVSLQNVMEVL